MFFPRSCKPDMLVIQTQTWAVKEKRPPNTPLQSYGVFISYLEKDHFYSRPQRTSKHCLLLGRLKLKSELPAAALETKEDKRKRERERERERKEERNRKENKPSARFTALEWEGSKYKILAEFCRVSAEVYTLTIRALLKMGGEKKESAGREKREGSNLISSALKGRVLAPVSDSPR